MEVTGSTYMIAEKYIKEFGMEERKPEFYKMFDHVAHTIAMRSIKRETRIPDSSYSKELNDLNLIGPDGYASEKGENLVKEVNSELYESLKES